MPKRMLMVVGREYTDEQKRAIDAAVAAHYGGDVYAFAEDYYALVGRIYDFSGPGSAWMCVLAMGSLSVVLICVLMAADRRAFPGIYNSPQKGESL